MSLRVRWMVVALAASAYACIGPGPIVDHHTHRLEEGVLAKVAIVPFYPTPRLSQGTGTPGLGAGEAADLVSRIVSEAFSAADIATVPPSDLVIGFEGEGKVLPRQDVSANAQLAAAAFGATAIVVGKVTRYRERVGGAAGAVKPASVFFELTLYRAPDGEKIFSARFDQTQQALSANPLLARQYPGSGSRWLSVAELTRWGAEETVRALPEILR